MKSQIFLDFKVDFFRLQKSTFSTSKFDFFYFKSRLFSTWTIEKLFLKRWNNLFKSGIKSQLKVEIGTTIYKI